MALQLDEFNSSIDEYKEFLKLRKKFNEFKDYLKQYQEFLQFKAFSSNSS